MSPQLEQHTFGYPQRVVEVRPIPIVRQEGGEMSIEDSGLLHEFGSTQAQHLGDYAIHKAGLLSQVGQPEQVRHQTAA